MPHTQGPPLWIILGYIAFLVVGYWQRPDWVPEVALYSFLGLLLLGMQWVISDTRSAFHNIYVFLTGIFALVYAADPLYFHGRFLLDQSVFYLVLNVLIIIVFIYDAVQRHVRPTPEARGKIERVTLVTIGANAGGFAVLCFIAAGLLYALELTGMVRTTPGIALADLVRYDIDLGVFGLIIAGLFLAAVAARLGWSARMGSGAMLLGVLGGVLGRAFDEGTRSLGLVLNPLIWLVPSYAIARFAQNVADDVVRASAVSTSNPWQVLNPGAAASQAYTTALANVGYGLIAVAAVVVAVAWAEHNAQTIVRTLKLIQRLAMAVGLSLGLVLIVLALTNVLVILVTRSAQPTPFQLGADAVVAFVVAIGLILASVVRVRNIAGRLT
ncbi:MAG TPA: hypothetical protein VIC85_01370 [Ktedonobacterales bacterium]